MLRSFGKVGCTWSGGEVCAAQECARGGVEKYHGVSSSIEIVEEGRLLLLHVEILLCDFIVERLEKLLAATKRV